MLKSILSTATFRQSQITILGTIINGILGALFYILMARFLGPSDFGLLTVSVAILTLIADIADFGTNTGLVRFIPLYLHSDREKAFKFLRLGLEIKFLVWITILILGIYFAPFIAEFIFKKNELEIPLKLVMVGVGGALFFTFTTTALQAYQKYFVWAFVNILSNFLRLILIFLLFLTSHLSLFSGLIAYIILPFFGFSLALLFLPTKQILSTKNQFSVAGQFFKFNSWVAIFTIIAAISSRLDTFLTARLLSSFELGVYGAANQLVQSVPQLVGALGVVAAPKFASFTSNKDMTSYLKKFQIFVLGLALVGLLIIPVSFYLIPTIFGTAYLAAITPFIILLFSMLVFLISVPIHNSIIFYFGKPNIFVWVSIGHLLIIAILGYLAIVNFGVIGASITVLTGSIFNFIAPLIWFFKFVKK